MRRLVFTVLLSLCGLCPFEAFSGDLVSEAWEAPKPPTSENCRLQHRELEFSWPELFVGIPLLDGEENGDAFSGLGQVQGLDFETYQRLLFGSVDAQWQGGKGVFAYSATATGAVTQSKDRRVIFTGLAAPDANGENPRRKVEITLVVKKGTQNEKPIQEIQAYVRHSKKGPFGVWLVVYEGQCSGLKKVSPGSPPEEALIAYRRNLGGVERKLLDQAKESPELSDVLDLIREFKEESEMALAKVREGRSFEVSKAALSSFRRSRLEKVASQNPAQKLGRCWQLFLTQEGLLWTALEKAH
jgi:hypothetical protein